MKIILSAALALFLLGCGEDKATSTQTDVSKPVHKVKAVIEQVKPEKVVTEAPVVKKETPKAAPKTPEIAEEKMLEKPIGVAEREVQKVVAKSTVKVESVKEEIVSVDGAKLFAKCVSCHGKNAEKKALNKSKVIKGWAVEDTVTALNGYKDGTYGSTMKGVMKPQVAKLTDAEVKAIAEYISKL